MGKSNQQNPRCQEGEPRKTREITARAWQLAHEYGLTSVGKIAKKTKMDQSNLCRVLYHGGKWTRYTLSNYARAFGKEPDWLEHGPPRAAESEATYAARQDSEPVVVRIAAADGQGAMVDFVNPLTRHSVKGKRQLGEVIGNCLAPIAFHGQHVIIDEDPMRPVHNGDLVVLETTDGQQYGKRAYLLGDTRDPDYLLVPVNPLEREQSVMVKSERVKRVHVIVGVRFE